MTQSFPRVTFDLRALHELDAVILRKVSGFPESPPWFYSFRVAKMGAANRPRGIVRDYDAIHRATSIDDIELHLSSLLFYVESAYECLIFAANTIGHATDPSGFLDPENPKELAKIDPRNLSVSACAKDLPRSYRKVFPRFVAHCLRHKDLLETINENHSVSKHRQMLLSGGRMAHDASPDSFGPMVEIHLSPDAKMPVALRTKAFVSLESVTSDFSVFYSRALRLLCDDVSNDPYWR